MITSLDGALVPHAFLPATRTKYTPLLTVADSVVAGLPVSMTAMSTPPGDEPAAITYEVGESADGDQFNVTVDPTTPAVKPAGVPAGDVQTVAPTTSVTSLDGAPLHTAFYPRTR